MSNQTAKLLKEKSALQQKIKALQAKLKTLEKNEHSFGGDNSESNAPRHVKPIKCAYEVLTEQVNEGVVVVDEKGIILFCNSAFAHFFNNTIDELVGKNIYHSCFPENTIISTFIQSGLSRPVQQEFSLSLQADDDFGPRTFLFSAAPFTASQSCLADVHENSPAISLLVQDVTLLKNVQDRLHKIESHFERQIKERTYELQLSNQQLEANEQKLQLANQQLLAKTKGLEHLEKEARQYADDLEASQRSALNLMEDALEKSNKLKQSEEFNRSIIDSSTDCIKILDLDGNLTFMSKGGQQLLEIDNIQPYINNSWIDFWKGEDKQNAFQAIQQAKNGDIGYFEGYSPTCKNTPKWWSVQVSPIYAPDGSVEKLLAVSRDITEQKKLKDQFLQSQKMESVGRLAGGVAHDLNNMLSIVIGYLELAMSKLPEDNPVQEDLAEIFNAAKRSSTTIRQLLAFARRQTIVPKVLNLNDTIEGMLKMLQRLIGEDIDLTWIPKSENCLVKMDPSQVDQILANLMVNARDAISDVGKITIQTENVILDKEYCREHGDILPGEYIQLAVSDDGCGMEKDILNQIFEPFFTTKQVGEGSGLGLATIFGIVKQNNGFILVYSEPGEGTTFKIYLPKLEQNIEPVQQEHKTEIPKSAGETVLIVEDEKMILKLGRQMLKKLHYHVLSADAPHKAITVAKNHAEKIDLFIIDVIMPEMNGQKLARQLQALHAEAKVLFMSGYTADAIAHRGVLDDDIVFLQKPFTIEDLAFKVHQALTEEQHVS